MRQRYLSRPVLLLLSTLFVVTAFAAKPEPVVPTNTKAVPWYQVEIVVFKRLGVDPERVEQWQQIPLVPAVTAAVDFLNPSDCGEPKTAAAASSQKRSGPGQADVPAQQAPGSLAPIQPCVAAPQTAAVELTSSTHKAKLPHAGTTHNNADNGVDQSWHQPAYEPLPKDDWTLSKQAKLIQRNSHLRILLHTAWQQPVTAKRDAATIRILGGMDFAGRFNDSGLKRDDPEPVDFTQRPLLTPPETTPPATSPTLPGTGTPTAAVPPTRQHHLWELDGTFQLRVKRYLHARFNLVLREPVAENVEVNPADITSLTLDDPATDSLNKATGWRLRWEDVGNSQQGDLALDERNPHIVKLETLRAFGLTQQRRMRSRELHYFDHPLVGILLLVTPLHAPTVLPEETNLPAKVPVNRQ